MINQAVMEKQEVLDRLKTVITKTDLMNNLQDIEREILLSAAARPPHKVCPGLIKMLDAILTKAQKDDYTD